MQRGEFPSAVAKLRKAISLDPKHGRAYANLGSALSKSRQLPEGVQVFRKALALETDNLATHLNRESALRENAVPQRRSSICAGWRGNNSFPKLEKIKDQILQLTRELSRLRAGDMAGLPDKKLRGTRSSAGRPRRASAMNPKEGRFGFYLRPGPS